MIIILRLSPPLSPIKQRPFDKKVERERKEMEGKERERRAKEREETVSYPVPSSVPRATCILIALGTTGAAEEGKRGTGATRKGTS